MLPPASVTLVLVFGSLLSPGGGSDDVYFEQTTIQSRDGRQEGPGVLSKVWFGGRKMRLEAGDAGGSAFILRLDRGKAYRIDGGTRVAVELDLKRLRARSHMDAATAGGLMAGPDEEPRTQPLRTAKTIAGYACRGFRISAGSTSIDVYVTDAIPVGVDAFREFLDWSGASSAMGGVLAEIRKLPGFPMETRSRINVLGHARETLSTITRIRVAPHPAALFETPPGYRIEKEEPLDP